jgi:hypothetical protein
MRQCDLCSHSIPTHFEFDNTLDHAPRLTKVFDVGGECS